MDATRRSLGFRIAIDDFGTGHSSLLRLIRLPISTVKIDRLFVYDIDKVMESRVVVAAVIRMARALDMALIAEGVETEMQALEMRSMQCDGLQGFFYHKPMSFTELCARTQEQASAQIRYEEILGSVIYVSDCAPDLDAQAVQYIVDQARRKNLRSGITGFLVYSGTQFMQFLEGEPTKIAELMEVIAADNRHSEVSVIDRGKSQFRLFSRWSMGLCCNKFEYQHVTHDFDMRQFAQNIPACRCLFSLLGSQL